MAKEFTTVQLRGGVNRLFNGDVHRPYNLENAEMRLNGFIRAVNEPSENTAETNETKPYIQWNGNVLDRAGYSSTEAGAIQNAEVLSHAALNARLYRSVKGEDLATDDNYRIVKHTANYDPSVSTSVGFQPEPALAYSAAFVEEDPTTYGFIASTDVPLNDVEEDLHVGYIAIPYDKNGEAGNWFHFTTQRRIRKVTGTNASVANIMLKGIITVKCNNYADRVDIYRTISMTNDGYVHSGPTKLPDDTADDNAEFSSRQEIDHRFFFLGSFQTSVNNSTGDREAKFPDENIWVGATAFEALKAEYTIDNKAKLKWLIRGGSNFYEQLDNVIEVPDTLLDEKRNHHSIHDDLVSTNDYLYLGISAEVMSPQGDIMMYGNVRVPTKRPTTGLILYNSDGTSANIQAQLEYKDNEGNFYYGPKETFNTVETIKFAWQGESALLIFVGGTLFERLKPNAQGVYVTSFKKDQTDDDGRQLPVTYVTGSDNGGVTFQEESGVSVVKYISEPNLVLLSDVNQPMTVTFDSFFLQRDETVRAITAARLAEEESIRAYDFYVFSNKSVRAYTRSGADLRTITPTHEITNGELGVAVSNFTALVGTTATSEALVATTRFGVAFIGTDQRVYHLSGRDLQQIDIEIPGLFSSLNGYRDIEYHANCNQIWVLFNTSIIWVYDFLQQGWTINRSLENIHYNLYYDDDSGFMRSWGDNFGTKHTYVFNELDANIHDRAQVMTRPMDDGGQDVEIRAMKIDYAITDYTDIVISTWATMRHAVRSPDVLGVEEVSSTTKRKVEYSIPANRTFYPTLVGRGHQFKISNFQELRDIQLSLKKTVY